LVEQLQDVPGLCLFRGRIADGEPTYYKLGFRFDEERFGLSRARFLAAVRAEGVAFDEGFRALHAERSPSRFRAAGPLPVADRAHLATIVLHHPVLLGTEEEIEQVALAIRKVHAHRDELR
jgi:dTDP-4-amino-4,6-dideoxygalactose transaminase